VADLIQLQDRLGFSRGVLVQPTALGRDNRLMLDVMAEHPDRFRGVVVPPDNVTDRELDRMHDLGVRGVRFVQLDAYTGTRPINAAFIKRIAERGWHAQMFIDGRKLKELRPTLEALPCDVVIDHMGHMPTTQGVANPAFASLLDMLDSGRTWVKISGPRRLSQQEGLPYSDVDAMARALITRRPDRCVWGSDWPHVGYGDGSTPNDADLLDLLHAWAPDQETQTRILVDNPARLYDFPERV
jgi:predicted TIM-barrel fold metal-dependent hydrolase